MSVTGPCLDKPPPCPSEQCLSQGPDLTSPHPVLLNSVCPRALPRQASTLSFWTVSVTGPCLDKPPPCPSEQCLCHRALPRQAPTLSFWTVSVTGPCLDKPPPCPSDQCLSQGPASTSPHPVLLISVCHKGPASTSPHPVLLNSVCPRALPRQASTLSFWTVSVTGPCLDKPPPYPSEQCLSQGPASTSPHPVLLNSVSVTGPCLDRPPPRPSEQCLCHRALPRQAPTPSFWTVSVTGPCLDKPPPCPSDQCLSQGPASTSPHPVLLNSVCHRALPRQAPTLSFWSVSVTGPCLDKPPPCPSDQCLCHNTAWLSFCLHFLYILVNIILFRECSTYIIVIHCRFSAQTKASVNTNECSLHVI